MNNIHRSRNKARTILNKININLLWLWFILFIVSFVVGALLLFSGSAAGEVNKAEPIVTTTSQVITTTTTAPPPTTTTTIVVKRTVPPETTPPVVIENSGGEDVWDRLATCESHNDWTYNGGSGFDGGLQFLPSTWTRLNDYFGMNTGYEFAWQAPREIQIKMAIKLMQVSSGTHSQWPVCSKSIGMPNKF